jgi:hypothetical protein
MAKRPDQSPRGDEPRQAPPRSGEPYGGVRGYGNDNGEADMIAGSQHGAHPEPPREKGDEFFEEQD